MDGDDILVLGGGIAGLLAGLLLGKDGRPVTIIERDPPFPGGDQDAIFAGWRRTGVGQIRHTHAFRARFRQLLEREAPDLLGALLSAGARQIPYADNLPPYLRSRSSRPDSVDTIAMRRTLFETILRDHLAAIDGVKLRTGAKAEGLLLAGPETDRRAAGLIVDGAPITARLVLDAGGRRSPVRGWLRAAGIELSDETLPCHLTYHTRFFALLPGAAEPAPPQGRTGDLGFLKFGVIPADNGTFSITLALPDTETALRSHVSTDAGFMALCAQLPGVAPFVDPAISRPLGRVCGMADLNSRWRSYATPGGPLLPGLVGIGDAFILANPLYGRGMTFALIEAICLRDALRAEHHFPAMLSRYEASARYALEDYFTDMRNQDRAAKTRADHLAGKAAPAPPPSGLSARLLDAARRALPHSPTLMRGLIRSIHMLDRPGRWHKGWRARLAALHPVLVRRTAPAAGNPTRDDIHRSISPVQP